MITFKWRIASKTQKNWYNEHQSCAQWYQGFLPECSGILKRQKNIESLGENIGSVGLGKYYYGENNKVTLFYKCENCNKLYSISELCIVMKSHLE